MTDLERIKESTDLQMALSEMLFKALNLGCWHEWNHTAMGLRTRWECQCGIIQHTSKAKPPTKNPNLFADWTGFGVVLEAVKYREDFKERFDIWASLPNRLIATPHFQLEVLKWLVGADKVEKVVKETP